MRTYDDDGLGRALIGTAKAAACVIVWLMAAVVVIRLGVPMLWGSGSDLGLVAAPLLAAGGLIGLAYLAVGMVRLVSRDFRQSRDTE